MDEACHLKLQKLEISDTSQEKKIHVLFKKQAQTDKALQDIKQIKYVLMGAVGFYIFDTVGLIKLLGFL